MDGMIVSNISQLGEHSIAGMVEMGPTDYRVYLPIMVTASP
jgi:hypothetical protein